jgi:hypothetical protein
MLEVPENPTEKAQQAVLRQRSACQPILDCPPLTILLEANVNGALNPFFELIFR